MLWNTKNNNPESMGRRIQVQEPEVPTSTPKRKKVSLAKINWRGIATGIFILAIIGGGITLGSYYSSGNTVKSVDVAGNGFTSENDILTKAGNLVSLHADSIRFIDVIEKIETLPYVKRASISVSPSGRLRIGVTERKPMGMFIQGSRRLYVDEDGIKLPLLSGKFVDVPLVYGIGLGSARDTLKSQDFVLVRDFLMATSTHPVASSTLSEIAWTIEEGIVALSHENGIRIVFGKDHFERSLSNWSMFYAQVVAVRGPEKFTTIDLRYGGQIVTRET